MNLSIKICDLCNSCAYADEYEIIEDEVVCIICIAEEQEEQDENEIQGRRMGDVRSISR